MSVLLPNFSQVNVEFVGDVCLSGLIMLINVMYIPTFAFNLIAISDLTHHLPIAVKFDSDLCVLHDQFSLTMIGKARVAHGLYVLEIIPCLVVVNFVMYDTCLVVTFDTWHYHLGHPSIKHMTTFEDVIHVEPKSFSSLCFVCPLTKQKKLSFVSNNNVASHIFELIHCDI